MCVTVPTAPAATTSTGAVCVSRGSGARTAARGCVPTGRLGCTASSAASATRHTHSGVLRTYMHKLTDTLTHTHMPLATHTQVCYALTCTNLQTHSHTHATRQTHSHSYIYERERERECDREREKERERERESAIERERERERGDLHNSYLYRLAVSCSSPHRLKVWHLCTLPLYLDGSILNIMILPILWVHSGFPIEVLLTLVPTCLSQR